MTSQRPDRNDSGYGQARRSISGMPRWVKVFLLVAVAIAVLAVVVMLLVGGEHGPGRHQPATTASQPGVETPVSSDLG
ncbi:MAG TPA: hypothetical protein VE645_18450 [Pseudonocardiaceae bacterium]|nr:hypothetical protein [Pseudonocardiaceae bacterium]